MRLMPVEAARAAMLAEVQALLAETVPLAEAIGRVLSQDVAAIRDQPPFTNSSMDGWAVRAADTPGTLRIVGESAAGHGYVGVLSPGEAVRIFTGAALPAGADTVVIQEDATREGERVTVPKSADDDNIRAAGRDFRAGDVLLRAGTRIDPWRLSLAASAGRAELAVHGRPRVAILSTGEEIVEAPATPGPFQIYDSGAPALLGMLQAWGAQATKVSGIGDHLDEVVEAMRGADAELIVTVGGASVGDHDLVRAAGEALGLKFKVESVNVRPGKPTFFGVLADGRRLLGLPGNPASAFVCAELFLKPLVAAFQGATAEPAMVAARLARPLGHNGPREHWMRAKLSFVDGGLVAEPYRDQDSSMVTVFAGADALLRRRGSAPAAEAGDLVEVLPLVRAG
jgi:molybdopterin molybdotransferase